MKWTKAYRKTHGTNWLWKIYKYDNNQQGKEMVIDSTFEFEKKRNEPIKYNRDLVVETVRAMKKVSAIKERREKDFWKMRLLILSYYNTNCLL